MHYVCSDIHGQYGLYLKLLKKLPLREEDTLYVLGDMIDRGPDSMGLLLDMMERKNVIPFLGNHEWMMLEYLENGPYAENWFYGRNDGRRTYTAFKALSEKVQEKILAYLKHSYLQLKVEVNGETFMLSHSYLIKSNPQGNVRFEEAPKEEVFACVWNSPYRLFEHADPSEYDDGNIHIIGHVPVMAIQENSEILLPFPNPVLGNKLIDIDGGCAALFYGTPGGLFAMSLEKTIFRKRKMVFIKGEPLNLPRL